MTNSNNNSNLSNAQREHARENGKKKFGAANGASDKKLNGPNRPSE